MFHSECTPKGLLFRMYLELLSSIYIFLLLFYPDLLQDVLKLASLKGINSHIELLQKLASFWIFQVWQCYFHSDTYFPEQENHYSSHSVLPGTVDGVVIDQCYAPIHHFAFQADQSLIHCLRGSDQTLYLSDD